MGANIYKQLRDYAEGKQTHRCLNSVAVSLTEQNSADLAIGYETLPAAQHSVKMQALNKAKVLVAKRNGKKITPLFYLSWQ